MKVGILIIGTGRYINFFDKLYESIMAKFLGDHTKQIYLFTDSTAAMPSNVTVIPVVRQGFPGDTLFRYNHFLSIRDKLLAETDVLYYLDIDSLVIDTCDNSILPTEDTPLIAAAHPGFYKMNMGTPETRRVSRAYIGPNEVRDHYVAGGIQGGLTKEYLSAVYTVNSLIYDDYNRGITPVWNDESMWNRYYVSNLSQFKVISPSYVYPECKYRNPRIGNYSSLISESVVPRVLALDKDHTWYRSI